jgi:hypothetical protein
MVRIATHPRMATNRREAAAVRPLDVRDPIRPDRPEADERLDERHHRRLHARRHREDDEDLRGR